jgi:hypothetical protein
VARLQCLYGYFNMAYVYGHYTNNTNELFYIGKGSGKRAYHKTTRNPYWKNVVAKQGYKVEIFIDNISHNEAYEIEERLIAKFNPKTNMAKGGENGREGAKARPETVQRMIKANTLNNLSRRHKFYCPDLGVCFLSCAAAAEYFNTYKSAITRAAKRMGTIRNQRIERII